MTLLEQLGWMKRMEKRAEEVGWGATVREHLRALEKKALEREASDDRHTHGGDE